MSRSITQKKCAVLRRRKRSNDGGYTHDKEIARLLKLMTPKDTHEIKKRIKVML
jgi:hypothetical protein